MKMIRKEEKATKEPTIIKIFLRIDRMKLKKGQFK